MSFHKLLVVKQFKHVKLMVSETGQVYVFWELNERQKSFLGQKLHWFDCYHRANLCELNLKRPHLTCSTCKLRRVVTGQILPLVPITLKQIWIYPDKSNLEYLLFKNLLSLTQVLS